MTTATFPPASMVLWTTLLCTFQALKKLSCDVFCARHCICQQGPELPVADSEKQWRSGDSIRRHSKEQQSGSFARHQQVSDNRSLWNCWRSCTLYGRGSGWRMCFLLREHIAYIQYGKNIHYHMLLTFVVSLFFKLKLHHIAKMTILSIQRNNMHQKLNKTVLFKGY